MRITRIDVQAFGCLSDFREEIAPGLHIFHGPNEAGKSTLQQAMLALLYSFYESDRARTSESRTRERLIPWNDGRYAAQLEYELQDGHAYRVARDFSSTDVPTTLWDVVTGRDVTDDFGRGRHNVPFMRRQLGMTKRVFEACAFVSQGELFEIAGEARVRPQEIGDTIVSLADTARRDVSAQSAIDRLARVFREQVGGPQARAAPVPVARGHLAEARRELEGVQSVQEEVRSDASALETAMRDAEALRETISRSRYLLYQAEIAELNGGLQRLRELAERAADLQRVIEEHAPFAGFRAEDRDGVVQTWGAIRDLRERVDAGQAEVEKQQRRLAELAQRRTSLARRQRELSHLREYPGEKKPTVDRLIISWRSAAAVDREAHARLAAALSKAEGLLEEHDQLHSDVGRLTAADLALLTERLRGSRAAQRPTIPGLLLAAAGRAWRMIVAAGRWALRKLVRSPEPEPAQEAEASTESEGADFGSLASQEVAVLLQRHRRYLEISPAVQKYHEERDAAGRSRSALDDSARQLAEALRGLVDDLSDLEVAHAVFSERAAGRSELEAVTDQLQSIESESASVEESVNQFKADQARLGRLEAQLGQQLETAVGRQGSLEELVASFEQGCRGRQALENAKRELREADERTGMVLGGKSPTELEELIKRREAEVADLLSESPSLAGARTSDNREALKEALSRQAAELQQQQLRIRGLRTAIETRLTGLRPRAEIEEEIERLERDVADLGKFGQALNIAIEVVTQAMTEAHRDFAPSVGRFLGAGLERITGGRYQKALLDPATLRVTTEVPETGRLQEVETLSRGTRAAAYLLLRVGLAQHMSAMSEPVPLLLDDPLVDLDDMRVEQFLELLSEISEEIQVLLFTKDERTRVWFERQCAGDPTHRLSVLPSRALAEPVGSALSVRLMG